MADSLFTVLDHDHAHGRYQPTGFSRGPWSPHALHGGPTAALVAHAAEQVLADSGADARLPVRLTLDLERPVPLAPLTVHAEIVRPGRKVAFHSDGTEHSLVQGSFGKLGPATDWIRLAVPVLPDVEPSPFQRVVAAADFLNGISSVVDPMQATYINPDLTVTVHRLPVGEWVAVDAVTRFEDLGIGTAEADLYDEQGRLGRAVQTLLLDPV